MMVSSSRQSSDAPGPKPNQRGPTSDTMEWRKGGNDTGSASRGSAKTPGRGSGRARGRGAGGRGRGGGRGPQNGNTDDSAPSTVPSIQETTPTPVDTQASGRTSRQKARKVPAPTSDDLLRPLTPQSARPRNLRRRSHQSTTTTKVFNSNSNPVTNKLLSVDTSGRKALTGPPTPISKDLPPHLAPSSTSDIPTFDIRTNIDALVERVRAVAMDRPHTPGSHIDWAGDDDDSLPDLDDWGIPPTSSKGGSVGDEHEKVSPTSENAPPPEGFPTKTESTPDAVSQNTEAPRPQKLERVRSKRGSRSRGNSRAQQLPPALETSTDNPVPRNHGVLTPLTPTRGAAGPDAKLHPSLPSKPLTPIEPVNPRAAAPAATPMRSALPPKPLTKADNVEVVPEEKHAAEGPKAAEDKTVLTLVPIEEPVVQPTHPRAFNPSHGRAHTVGRFAVERPPNSAPTSTFPDVPPISDTSIRSQLRSAGFQHSRNHSSPPVTRTPQTTRPVLTGDALSRLARTLGSPPRKESPPSVVVAKD